MGKEVEQTEVRICHSAVDEEGDEVILRGSLSPESLDNLQVAPYQREILPLVTLGSLVKAFEAGAAVPDVDLGMRGERYDGEGDCIVLKDPVYIIDGLQRINAALHLLRTTGKKPRLGASVHFNTTEPSERERFRILNVDRTKLSPNVLARNMREDVPVIDLLYNLCFDHGFVLCDKVSWNQRQRREELITALTFMKVVGNLHSHVGPGRSSEIHMLAAGLQQIMEITGAKVFKENVKTFFGLIDECWNIQQIVFKEGAVHLRLTFLLMVARVLSSHIDFWKGKRLYIERSLVRKIAGFPIGDPQVNQLASSGGKAGEILYILMVDHINSSKRTKRLRHRSLAGSDTVPPVDVDEADNDE